MPLTSVYLSAKTCVGYLNITILKSGLCYSYNMETQEWLNQCKNWTEEDNRLFDEGRKSGTAINRFTDKPITKEDIIKLHDSLPY